MKKRTVKNSLTFLLFVTAALGVFLVGYWYKGQQGKQKKEAVSDVKTVDWKTYVNQKFNYSVKYPPQLVLDPLFSEDDPDTVEVEVGDEGTFLGEAEATPGQLRKTMVVGARYLRPSQKNMSLREFVETQGAVDNPCQEPKPGKTEDVTTKSGVKGIKVWYYVMKGCAGATERGLNDPYVYFDVRPDKNAVIEFYEGQVDDVFDDIVSTFTFVTAQTYGD